MRLTVRSSILDSQTTMEFAIEAPGAANPLSAETLCRTLAMGVGGNNQQIQIATNQLKEWERTQGYFPLLQVSALVLERPTRR